MSVATAKRSPSKEGLIMVERYDTFCRYIYPQIQNMPRSHGKFRDKVLDVLLKIPGEIYLAAKLQQISKLHILDSSLSEMRWCLRFAADPANKLITKKQQEVAEILLSEVGGMLNAWKNKVR